MNNKLEERDKKLVESLRAIQETKKEVAATTQNKWWQFWK
ncbi:DUF3967 domain-containing protein [Siminovitchia terrae]|nr:DUF3967 domain-containing protein [Siminovitchia terrae]